MTREIDFTSSEIDSANMDNVARGISRRAFVLGTLSLAIGAGGIATGLYGVLKANETNSRLDRYAGRVQEEDPVLREEIESLREELEDNTITDCFNENVLRQALGAPPVDFAECRGQRAQTGDLNREVYRRTPTSTPWPTRTPKP